MSSSRSKQITNLHRHSRNTRSFFAYRRQTEEHERGLHPPDGWDLSAELDKTHTRVNRAMVSPPSRPGDYHSWSWGFPMPCLTWARCPSRTFPNSQSQLKRSCRWLVSFWSTYEKRWPLAPVCQTELGPAATFVALGHLPHRLSTFLFLLPLGMVVIYILTYIYIYL
jgi:hypothetical protein